jgi:uncharacterized protein YggL (DUF469 family)
MSQEITRNRRQRKKMHLDEWAILGFEFSCTLDKASEADYGLFFDSLEELVSTQHLYMTIENDSETFEGFVTSADRYGNATEEDRTSVETLMNSHKIVKDVKIGKLVDAFYEL